MRRRLLSLLAALAFALAGASAVRAAPADVSYSIWNIQGPVARVRFLLPIQAAKRLVPGTPRLDSAGAAAAAGDLLAVSSAGGECQPQIQNEYVGKYYILATADGEYRFEMSFICPDARGMVLHDKVLFDQAPGHVNYAKVQVNGAPPVLRLFTRARQDIALPASGPLPGEGLGPFARQGLERLARGADAAALVAGLLLLARRWRDLADIAGALALGYAIALVFALGGRAAPDLSLAAAGAGLAAALLGLSALRLQLADAPTGRGARLAAMAGLALVAAALAAAGSARGLSAGLATAGLVVFGLAQAWIVGTRPRMGLLMFLPAVLFGALDGTSWAQALAPLRMPGPGLAPAALGYDLGACASLAAAAALAMALLWLAGRRLRPLRAVSADLAAAALTGLGLFWFVSRLYSV